MKINIVFPYNTWGGAFRSTYELSNRMIKKGHDIVIYFPLLPLLEGKSLFSISGFKLFVRGFFRSLVRRNKIPWFNLNAKVKMVISFHDWFIRDADIIIANHWPTASKVYQLSEKKGEKFYCIRDVEPWSDEYEKQIQAFKLPMKRFVTTNWLKNYLEKNIGVEVHGIVTNGTNIKDFEVKNKKYNSTPVLTMLYATHPMKGMKDGLEALHKIKLNFPEIEILLFGFVKPPHLNFETTFILRPFKEQLRRIYARTDIFLCPSIQEGYHNPPREAMVAKCAVVATNVGCIPHCAIPGKTALIVEPGDVSGMVENITWLIENPKKIKTMGDVAYKHMKNFNWGNSVVELETILGIQTQ